MGEKYVFGETDYGSELERLQAIEKIFDAESEGVLKPTGVSRGWHCLEVGAGAGSIARWLSAQVGEEGGVTAVDLNSRFLNHLSETNISVVEGDFHTLKLCGENDLVHARYFLVHDPEPETSIARMLELLKPGGWLVLEEPDFSAKRAAAGTDSGIEAFEKVRTAIHHMFESKGTDWSMGFKLPALLNEMSCRNIFAEQDAPLTRGESGIAGMMKQSAEQLKDKYLETGAVTEEELESYSSLAQDPNSWAVYYATIRVRGQKK